MVIADFDSSEGSYTVVKENGRYNVLLGDTVVQPNHDADSIIRYLGNMAHNLNFLLSKRPA